MLKLTDEDLGRIEMLHETATLYEIAEFYGTYQCFLLQKLNKWRKKIMLLEKETGREKCLYAER